MELNIGQVRELLSYSYDPRTTKPSANHQHLWEFRTKEFRDGDVAERFHENTKFTADSHRSDTSTIGHFVNDDTMQFVQGRMKPDYENFEAVDLPDPEPLDADLGEVLQHRRSVRAYSGDGISLSELSSLLAYACGTNGELGAHDEFPAEAQSTGRTYPSGGGLYPVEHYFAVLNAGEGLSEGLYYYVPDDHRLRVLRSGDVASEVEEFFQPPAILDPADAALSFLLTGAFWRSKAKYGPRAYRFVLEEAGHIVQNIQLVALALGYGSVPIAAVHDDEADAFLGVDGVEESLVYAGFVGAPRGAADA